MKNKPVVIKNIGLPIGLAAGILMFLFLALMELSYREPGLFGKFFKYLLLFGFLIFSNYRLFKKYEGKRFFRKGIVLGIYTTLAAAFTLIIANFIYWGVFHTLPVNSFGEYEYSIGNMLSLQGVLLFEMFVIGMILNFIILQYYKSRR